MLVRGSRGATWHYIAIFCHNNNNNINKNNNMISCFHDNIPTLGPEEGRGWMATPLPPTWFKLEACGLLASEYRDGSAVLNSSHQPQRKEDEKREEGWSELVSHAQPPTRSSGYAYQRVLQWNCPTGTSGPSPERGGLTGSPLRSARTPAFLIA